MQGHKCRHFSVACCNVLTDRLCAWQIPVASAIRSFGLLPVEWRGSTWRWPGWRRECRATHHHHRPAAAHHIWSWPHHSGRWHGRTARWCVRRWREWHDSSLFPFAVASASDAAAFTLSWLASTNSWRAVRRSRPGCERPSPNRVGNVLCFEHPVHVGDEDGTESVSGVKLRLAKDRMSGAILDKLTESKAPHPIAFTCSRVSLMRLRSCYSELNSCRGRCALSMHRTPQLTLHLFLGQKLTRAERFFG